MFLPKYNEEQKNIWLAEFKNNTKSAKAYAKEIGVPASTFRLWVKQDISEQYEGKFGAISIVNDLTEENDEKQIIYTGSKIKIVLEKGYNKQHLRDVVEVLINDR